MAYAQARVAKIRAGSGQIDTAGDCVALAALFTEHGEAAMVVGGVTAGDLANAASVGSRSCACCGRPRPGGP